MNLIDCTLRDGGYYNNWFFSKKLINQYLKNISKLKIKYCELGFRFLDRKINKGFTAYTEDGFLDEINIPHNIKIGVMINASDFLDGRKIKIKSLEKIFLKKNEKIFFVRIACHLKEIFYIKPIVNYLKSKSHLVMVNLMQVSEVSKSDLVKISKYINKLDIKVFYLADSLGSLTLNKLTKILQNLKNNIKIDLGLHAHDNLNLAFKNSIFAYKKGVKWIDSTVLGMGRGAGNLKTEDIIRHIRPKKLNILNTFIKKNFLIIKKKYNWGTNKFYKFAALNKIHPSYIQNLVSDIRFKNINIKSILNNLKFLESKKYNPNNILFSLDLFNTKVFKSDPFIDLLKNKNIILIGSGIEKSNKKKLENIINKKKFFVVTLNNNYILKRKLVDLRLISHPMRLLSFEAASKKFDSPIISPIKNIKPKLRWVLFNKNIETFHFGMKINKNVFIKIKKNFLETSSPLALTYALSIFYLAKIKTIHIAGFKDRNFDNFQIDESKKVFNFFKKKIRFVSLIN